MKRKFYSIAKKHNCTIKSYETYRNDMGCQVYELEAQIIEGEDLFYFIDSYYIGEEGGKDSVLKYFEEQLIKDIKYHEPINEIEDALEEIYKINNNQVEMDIQKKINKYLKYKIQLLKSLTPF